MLQGAWTLASLAKILIIQKSKRTKCYSPHPYIKTHHGPCRVIQNCFSIKRKTTTTTTTTNTQNREKWPSRVGIHTPFPLCVYGLNAETTWYLCLRAILDLSICHYHLPIFLPTDIDECATNTHSCDANAYCNNTIGSFNCTCNPGYNGTGTYCNGKYYLYWLLKED